MRSPTNCCNLTTDGPMKRIVILLLPSLLSLEAEARVASMQIEAVSRTTLSPLEMAAGIVLIVCLALSIWAVMMANRARRIAALLRRDFKEPKMQVDWTQAYGKQGGAHGPKNNKGNAKPNSQLTQMANDMVGVLGRLNRIEEYLPKLDGWVKKTDKSIKILQQEKPSPDYHDPAPSPEISLPITPSETILYAQLDASDSKRLFNVSKDYDSSKHIYKIILKGEEQIGDLEIIEENASKVFSNSDCSRCCNFSVMPDPSNFKQIPGKARVKGDTAEVLKKIEVSSK